MVRLFLAFITGAAIIAVNFAVPAAQQLVEIRLNGRYFSEPATIRVTVAVEPDDNNRTLVIQADGERLFRSSQVALDGDKGQRLHTMEFKNLPAGQYVLRAEVRSNVEVRATDEQLLVVGHPGEQEGEDRK